MPLEITLPNFGGSGGESTLTRWLIEAGSKVEAGQVIAEIETEKAVAELTAPQSGIIESLEIAAGSEGVAVGAVVARMRTPESEPADTPPSSLPEISDRVLASPYARKQASERNLSLHGISGSGPGGRIVSRDLAGSDPMPTQTSALASSSLHALGYASDSYVLTPANKMRRAIAERMTRSVREIPHFSLTVDIELDTALKHRQTANERLQHGAAKISINDLLIRACARALQAVPAANSSWTEAGIALHRHANIAVAVAVEDGLLTPVIRAAESKTLAEIAAASSAAIQRAKARQLGAQELQGATFTISNLGMLGIKSFTSILSEPQACILSVGTAEQRPVVRSGELSVATLATLTLTCDHRVVDGAVGAHFLQKLHEYLNAPPD